jgi:hypothetical protein
MKKIIAFIIEAHDLWMYLFVGFSIGFATAIQLVLG